MDELEGWFIELCFEHALNFCLQHGVGRAFLAVDAADVKSALAK